MDRELVVRAQGGDRDAFSVLAATSLGRLNAVARLIVRDEQGAEDAVQDALVEAWRSIRGLRNPDRFEAWLHRLLVRACYSHARKGRRQQVAEIRLLPTDGSIEADAQRALAIHDQLERGLRRLQPDQRAVLVLTYYLDLPLAEAAEILAVPTGTVKSRLNRALSALRAVLEADEREPGRVKERLA
jgi:RNA polymerase sigma-70 factor (ECF subfamily)